MRKSIFIAGTDTDVGKTYISCLILQALNNCGLQTFAIKPIASGCALNKDGQWLNKDALALQQQATLEASYLEVNPIAFAKPIAPHIAAQENQYKLTKLKVAQVMNQEKNTAADIVLIEGAGGWFLPLNAEEKLSDVIIECRIPVVLVVGMRLGCLNHALLTAYAMQAQGANYIGWVANCIDPEMLHLQDNIDSLKQMLPMPCLGVVPFEGGWHHIHIDNLLGECGITRR